MTSAVFPGEMLKSGFLLDVRMRVVWEEVKEERGKGKIREEAENMSQEIEEESRGGFKKQKADIVLK